MTGVDLVAVGASWGGLHAIETVLGSLPADFGAAVVIAQHRQNDGRDGALERLLDARCALAVAEAEDKQALVPGAVVVAPADYHLLVERDAVSLSVDEPLHFSRPSIDVLLGSAADAYGDRVAGVILTGANADGAVGLAKIAARGGVAIVQNPATAERREMPDAALWSTPEARVLDLAQIGAALVELATSSAGSLP
ncbi:MAG: two-component system, chemotaxis family, protein-glutamate methylesterase/glutaminase [Solirubrobacteraceae bacterium]|jgi:two-component system chemotaxis response regulator CheB|nr:two-component system, chemotaxis family, protein-glutamate methylesterase/glutaminase [Solirubrobacteraceae bacterium]